MANKRLKWANLLPILVTMVFWFLDRPKLAAVLVLAAAFLSYWIWAGG